MAECPICVTNFNKSTRKPLECTVCSKGACRVCVGAYLLTVASPKCMHCAAPWSLAFVMNNMGKSFRAEWKAHIEEHLFQSEQSLMPETQRRLEWELNERLRVILAPRLLERLAQKPSCFCCGNVCAHLPQLPQSAARAAPQLQWCCTRCEFTLCEPCLRMARCVGSDAVQLDLDDKHVYCPSCGHWDPIPATISITAKVPLIWRKFAEQPTFQMMLEQIQAAPMFAHVRQHQLRIVSGLQENLLTAREPDPSVIGSLPCQFNGCRGFLVDWQCGLCGNATCSECFKIAGEDHECNEDDMKTFEVMMATTKPCPNCKMAISKVAGCDQMFCTNCHFKFNWKSLSEERTIYFHNPHLTEYLQLRREVRDDVVARSLSLAEQLRACLSQQNRRTKLMSVTYEFMVFNNRSMRALAGLTTWNNEGLRRDYLTEKLSADEFKAALFKTKQIHDAAVHLQAMLEPAIERMLHFLGFYLKCRDVVLEGHFQGDPNTFDTRRLVAYSRLDECIRDVPATLLNRIHARDLFSKLNIWY